MKREIRGFSLISAIFLVVVLAALAVFAVSLSRVQQATIAYDDLGLRARQAAKAGLDWGRFQIFRAGGGCAATTLLAMPAGTTLQGFVTNVTCTMTTHTEAGSPVTIYTLVSTACFLPGGGPCPNPAPGADYVERQLQEVVE